MSPGHFRSGSSGFLLFLSADLGQLCRFVVALMPQLGEFLSAHPEHTGKDEYNSIPASCLSFVLAAHTHTGFPFSQGDTAPSMYLAHVNARNRNGKAIILIAPLPHCQEIYRIRRTGSEHGWSFEFSACVHGSPRFVFR